MTYINIVKTLGMGHTWDELDSTIDTYMQKHRCTILRW